MKVPGKLCNLQNYSQRLTDAELIRGAIRLGHDCEEPAAKFLFFS